MVLTVLPLQFSLGEAAENESPPAADNAAEHPFDRQWLVDQARQLAAQPYQPQRIAADSPLNSLSYDEYRTMVFNPNKALWRREDRSFIAEFYHPGFLFNIPVHINEVVGGVSREVPFSTDFFSYFSADTEKYRDVPAEGFSGFRLAYPINSPDSLNEFVVFQGASYFRSLGRDQFYGLSARGLAINTARVEGEEFPVFRDFWLERPEVGATEMVVHALLDSQSVTGAYTFRIRPGTATTMDVEATLFARVSLEHFGIAPLTSMFLFDATNHNRFDDFRPAVHDSEGLSMWNRDGEWIWRPLANPQTLQSSAFIDASPRGFGLMQRHQDFTAFEDNEARYEKRPSLWIEPLGEWGEGHVELVEIPSDEEVNDNIVAYWQPKAPLVPGEARSYSYRMHWGRDLPGLVGAADSEGRVVDTREGAVPKSNRASETERQFVVDFEGAHIPEDLQVRFTTSAGRITDVRGETLETTGMYRTHLKFDPQDAKVAELRMTLTSNGKQWGETWLYRWTR